REVALLHAHLENASGLRLAARDELLDRGDRLVRLLAGVRGAGGADAEHQRAERGGPRRSSMRPVSASRRLVRATPACRESVQSPGEPGTRTGHQSDQYVHVASSPLDGRYCALT